VFLLESTENTHRYFDLSSRGVSIVIMAFLAAMDTTTGQPLPVGMKHGANGAICYSEDGIGDIRVALYTSFVRGIANESIVSFLEKLWASTDIPEADRVRDAWLIAMQGRDVRGGKGERDAFYELFSEIACKRPLAETMKMLELIPEYGCWRDMFFLMHENPLLIAPIHTIISKQFFKDLTAARSQEKQQISLLAKWLPREKTDERLAADLAETLYPTIKDKKGQLMFYRRHCSEINRALKTVEVAQCGGAWRTIEPSAVPGRALKLYRKALLNEKLNGRPGRRSEEEDRIACAERFSEHLEKVAKGEATVKGADTVFPHEIVQKIMRAGGAEEQLLEGQWVSIRDKVAAAGVMGKCVPMCDFSGSMDGTPLQVSLALGLLLSEVSHPAFRNGMMTFDSTPKWVKFNSDMTLAQKAHCALRHGQGLSTNFEAAMKLILNRMVDAKVPVGEEPDALVVFTDMGFDAAAHGGAPYDTIVERYQKLFAQMGGWKIPTIVLWNLRASYKDYHARADRKGVIMLSGWSPSSMKILTTGIKVQTPYEGMREILDNKRYDAVRAALTAVPA
jgi:hypothetical protein